MEVIHGPGGSYDNPEYVRYLI